MEDPYIDAVLPYHRRYDSTVEAAVGLHKNEMAEARKTYSEARDAALELYYNEKREAFARYKITVENALQIYKDATALADAELRQVRALAGAALDRGIAEKTEDFFGTRE